ncbi:hypothetical protein BZG02_17645 [Labilibaculum filiforme]|uniref:HTH araC/xylS-type domain-containing protein n=1 Tax=Labilibaculum filiforme TaxID=1940526 RepID=A0A2N3HSE5_9BACT|nr:helix-turn-helix domain-containing protein [Labilibaculum filiforme]PKQ60970.1 hypothetical protein BZG02_17645 [Labilibaculum filiforme]
MKIYDNIKEYFLNASSEANDYSNQFYIRSIKEDRIKNAKPDEIYIEPHKRDFFEIAVLLRNTKSIQIGDQTLPEMERSLAIVSPFQIINFEDKSPNDMDDGYVICFKASLFHRLNQSYEVQNEFPFFKIHTLPLYHLSEDDFCEILSIIEEIYRESRGNKINSLEVVRSLLLIFLYKVKRITQENEGIVTMNRFDAIMSKFEYEILSGKDGFLSVNEYASKLNISPIYLSECVKKATGKSAQKVIIDYKILHAQTLLHHMEKSISDVAEILGFNEVANFNQFFKRNTGMTATQFRRRGQLE